MTLKKKKHIPRMNFYSLITPTQKQILLRLRFQNQIK